MQKSRVFLLSIFTLALSISFVSAFSFSDLFSGSITGNVAAADNTPLNDWTNCIDSDKGAFSSKEGAVSKYNSRGKLVQVKADQCIGLKRKFDGVKKHSSVREYYCGDKGLVRSKAVRCENGCETTDVTLANGKTSKVGRCVTPA